MNTEPGGHSKCQDRENCTGPGCRKHRPKHVQRPLAQKTEKEQDA